MKSISNSVKARVIGLHQSGLSPFGVYKQLKAIVGKNSVYRILKDKDNILRENKDDKEFISNVGETKKDYISQLESKIQMAFDCLTQEKFDEAKARDATISLATLIDKKELLSGRPTDRIDVEGMTHQERIIFIRTGQLPERMRIPQEREENH